MKKYIMSIDQGTTGSSVFIIDQAGGLVASESQDFKQIFPQPGWVEHDPNAIWESVENCAKKLTSQNQFEIATVGITNQRETVLAWRKTTSEILHNAIVWQCRRTTPMCQKLKPQFEKIIKRRTGLVLDPYFSATKMRWMLDNSKEVQKAFREKDLAFGTIDTFILWKITGGASYFTDVSNASRTLLMNLKTLNWDEELLKIFKISKECLPQIKSSADDFGFSKGCSFLKDQTPINGIAGDQQAALFGQAAFSVGDSKCTFGTGSFILMNTGKNILTSKSGVLSTVAWKIKNEPAQYALEGGAFICGAAVGWLRDGLGIISKSAEVESLALKVQDTAGVEFVPALAGLGAPHWDPQARGEITGLTRGTTKEHVARATLEAMALQNADILRAMSKDLKKKIKSIRVDGGAAENNLLMQLQSDYTQSKVVRPRLIETTGIGAAYLAGVGSGIWKSTSEIEKIWRLDREFKPAIKSKALKDRLAKWAVAIRKVKIK